MRISDGVDLEGSLVAALVSCGRTAHEIAQDHHLDLGSNGNTFGNDRYHRGAELAREALVDHGFTCHRRGAALIARRGSLELQFAVARGQDLRDAAAFDADSSPARRRAAEANVWHPVLPGMPGPDPAQIFHVVWSGTVEEGLTATHIGQLVGVAGERLTWADLVRVDGPARPVAAASDEQQPAQDYASQPEPVLRVEARPAERQAPTREG
jgi:hypothetical protein